MQNKSLSITSPPKLIHISCKIMNSIYTPAFLFSKFAFTIQKESTWHHRYMSWIHKKNSDFLLTIISFFSTKYHCILESSLAPFLHSTESNNNLLFKNYTDKISFTSVIIFLNMKKFQHKHCFIILQHFP